jgi:hypothetical protein
MAFATRGLQPHDERRAMPARVRRLDFQRRQRNVLQSGSSDRQTRAGTKAAFVGIDGLRATDAATMNTAGAHPSRRACARGCA